MESHIIKSTSHFANLLQMMGSIPTEELKLFLSKCHRITCEANEIFLKEGEPAEMLFFLESGSARNFTSDKIGNEHTTHFSFANQFHADYRAFITHTNSAYSLQALEVCSLIVIPREAHHWMIHNVKNGQEIVLRITESFIVYFATRLRDNYVLTPLERYQAMEEKFPGIYERVPQYMIASYIGVSKVHLSRIKNQALRLKD